MYWIHSWVPLYYPTLPSCHTQVTENCVQWSTVIESASANLKEIPKHECETFPQHSMHFDQRKRVQNKAKNQEFFSRMCCARKGLEHNHLMWTYKGVGIRWVGDLFTRRLGGDIDVHPASWKYSTICCWFRFVCTNIFSVGANESRPRGAPVVPLNRSQRRQNVFAGS